MKITPVLVGHVKPVGSRQNNVLNLFYNGVSDISNIGAYCAVPFLGNSDYQYKPVSCEKPNYALLDTQYKDIDEFCELYVQKLNSQLMTATKEDVENLVNRIKLKTKAPDKLIKEVLYSLTLLSGYNAINYFEGLSKKFSTNFFGVNPLEIDDFADASLNTALNYISSEKQLFSDYPTQKRIVVLDDNFLQELEYSKLSKNPAYSTFLQRIKKDDLVFVNIPGWDVKCLDDNFRSANFLLGTGFLEDIATDTIKRINRGEKLEDVLYGDFEKRLKNLTKPDVEVYKIPVPQKTGVITTEDILKNIETPQLSKDEIKKTILKEANFVQPESLRNKFTEALCKFLGEFSIVYSPNSMALDLTKIHEIIKNKVDKTKNTAYCIATSEKSPSYIISVYAKLNNVSPFDVISCTNKGYYELLDKLKNKNAVFLDDNSITAGSILGLTSDIPNFNMYWFVLLATNQAVEKLNDKKNAPIPKNFDCLRRLKNEIDKKGFKSESELLTKQEAELLKENISWGYEDSGVMCAFPYMIPDNCIDISAVLFSKLLFKNNGQTNKTLCEYQSRTESARNKQISFCGYKPISKVEPDYNLLNCDYSDIDEFSLLFADKINSQLRTVELSDVEGLAQRIADNTSTDINIVNDILYQLTLFSNYSAIDKLQELTQYFKTSRFGFRYNNDYPFSDISSNASLNYLADNKKIIDYPDTKEKYSLVVLDGMLLQELEYSKKTGTDFYKKFIQDLKENKIKLINLKGWDIECSDKIYRSAAFLYGTGQLEDLASDVAKRVQKGENIDDILYSDIENKLKQLIADDIDENDIQITRYAPKVTNKPKTSKDVFINLQRPRLNPSAVKKAMISCSGYTNEQNKNVKQILELYAKYLDEFSTAYSFDSICSDLTELKHQIDNKYGKNALYLVCLVCKSYSLVSNLYAKVNNIRPELFFDMVLDKVNHNKMKEETKYPTVMLDDISASGKSVDMQIHSQGFQKYIRQGMTYNFALILAADKAQEAFCSEFFTKVDLTFARSIKDLSISESSLMDDSELQQLSKILSLGYANMGISVVFPYIIPDNCSDLSAKVFNELLIKSNIHTNKAISGTT